MATDEVWRLQREKDPECVFFQKMAEQGHFGGNTGRTRQGIYVCAPSGAFLGSTNSLNPKRVMRMLTSALEKWEALPANERKLDTDSKIKPAHRWEDSYPEKGLVLSMFVRDLPEKCDPEAPSQTKWNRDFVWFSAKEARQWLPEKLEVDATHQLPTALSNRLSRFHLVDVARGQAEPMRTEQVTKTAIETRVVSINDEQISLQITGRSVGDAEIDEASVLNGGFRRWNRPVDHGVRTELLGNAIFDLSQNRFVEFEFVALGARWGRTRFNGRSRDRENTSPLGYVFRMASENDPRIAPGFIAYYQASWIQQPTQPVDREFKDNE